MPKRTELLHPHHRGWPDRDRPGQRIRLFRHASVQGSQGRGIPDRPDQFQSGDDHDRPGSGRFDLYRADHAGNRRQGHRARARGSSWRTHGASANHGRADRAQHLAPALPQRHARKVRRRDDRRQGPCHRQGRGSPAVPRGDDQDRACDPALEAGPKPRRGAGRARIRPASGHHPAVLHAWRHGRRHRLQSRRIHAHRRAGPRSLAHDADL